MADAFPDLDDVIERFEHDREFADCDVGDYLPDSRHPHLSEIAVELFRVDLEYRFDSGQQPTAGDYAARFPDALCDPEQLAVLAFEEYRLRAAAGEAVNPRDYAERYGIRTDSWPAGSTVRLAGDISEPGGSVLHDDQLQPGFHFDGFVLAEELGRGAMARVFRATQTGIARRDVVLKFSDQHSLEICRLGRLQHASVMPVLSAHAYNSGLAICMPYFGCRTLVDVIRLRGRSDQQALCRLPGWVSAQSFEQYVLRLAVEVAGGLAHAHAHDVLHRDIKPANILLADDGRPMLLDFNLSDDLKESRQSIIGGTERYMPPEQAAAIRDPSGQLRPDARCDIYALGAVICELLTGETPTEGGHPLPKLRQHASPALAAIVGKCLEPDPQARYSTAAELLEDLTRQRSDLPLRHQREPSLRERIQKWGRRHPRLSSTATVVSVFSVVLLVAAAAWSARSVRLSQLEARSRFDELIHELPEVRSLLILNDPQAEALEEGTHRGTALLTELRDNTPTSLLDPPRLARRQSAVGELLFDLALARQRSSVGKSSEQDRADSLKAAATLNHAAADWFHDHVGSVPQAVRSLSHRLAGKPRSEILHGNKPTSPLDQMLAAVEFNQTRQFDKTIELLDGIKTQFATDVSFWNLLGSAHAGQRQFAEADSCFTVCIAFKPDSWVAWANRGLARLAMKRFSQAEADFSQVIQLRPRDYGGYLNRALARAARERLDGAVDDLDAALARGGPTRIYFLRSRYRAKLGDTDGARSDFKSGLTATPTDPKSWVARGLAQLARDPDAALSDFRTALTLQPDSPDGLRNVAHVLAERLHQPDAAIDALTRSLDANPSDSAAFAGRAVLHARAGRGDLATSDIDAALELSSDALTQYQAACVYALLSADNDSARTRTLSLLAACFRQRPELAPFSRRDADLALLHGDPEYAGLVRASELLRATENGTARPASRLHADP